jgi:phenylalanyl-tRNA synthetase beta chain
MGLEVESIDDPGKKLAPFTIARVLEAKPHPNADRLRVCKVDTGKGIVEVVCGAPNTKSGMIGVFAPIGSHIPGTGITLDARPVRGVVSAGMLVSERELQISDNHEGIIELDAAYADKLGQRYAEAMGLADPVLDVKPRPTGPRTGVRGIARDLAPPAWASSSPRRRSRASKAASTARSPLSSTSPRRRATPARALPGATSAASATAPRRPGCSSASRRWASGRSMRWWT